jgi:hypothetical protein
MEGAPYLAGRLIDQDFALNHFPPESLVVANHPIDAEQEREIRVPVVAEKFCRLPDHQGRVASPLCLRNRNDATDAAYENCRIVRDCRMLQYGGMADRTFRAVYGCA